MDRTIMLIHPLQLKYHFKIDKIAWFFYKIKALLGTFFHKIWCHFLLIDNLL
jgi:hypothetical protein